MLPVVERFLRYAQVHTQSDRETGLNPSTPGQLKFAYLLQDEMTAMGMEDVTVDAPAGPVEYKILKVER